MKQMNITIPEETYNFLKRHGLYGINCVNYAIRKIQEEKTTQRELEKEFKIIKLESDIIDNELQLTGSKVLLKKLEKELYNIKTNNPDDNSHEPNIFHSEVEYYPRNNKKRNYLPRGLRHEVFKRDGYRCVECGASVEDGATLHIDHIIPVSRGGYDELDNLQTLCKECNMNKSNLYQKPRNR